MGDFTNEKLVPKVALQGFKSSLKGNGRHGTNKMTTNFDGIPVNCTKQTIDGADHETYTYNSTAVVACG